MKKTSFAVVTIVLSILLVSCGKVASPDSSRVTVRSAGRLHAAVSDTSYGSAGVKRVRVTVTGAGMDEMVVSSDYISSGFEIRMDVPNGSHRHFMVEGLDSGGTAIYKGASFADLSGEPITLTVDMYMVDLTPPTVVSTDPAGNAVDVAVGGAISVTFSEAMNAATITGGTFFVEAAYSPLSAPRSGARVSRSAGTVAGTVTYEGLAAKFTPSANLGYSTTYTVTVTTGAQDAAGNALAADYTWSFSTTAAPAPVVTRWSKTYGDDLLKDGLEVVRATSDGGYVCVGLMEDMRSVAKPSVGKAAGRANKAIGNIISDLLPEASTDAMVLKVNASGGIEWQKSFSGAYGLGDYLYDVLETSDGYIIAGETGSSGAGGYDGWIVKLNLDGSEAWQYTYGGEGSDGLLSITDTADGNYIAAGYTYSYNSDGDAWIVKLDPAGGVLWERIIGEPGPGNTEEINKIISTSDGYVIAGHTKSFDNGHFYDAWLLKLSADGNTSLWNKGVFVSQWGEFLSLVELEGGDIVALGSTYNPDNQSYDALAIRFGKDNGSPVWANLYGGTGDDYGTSVSLSGDGGIIVTGHHDLHAGWLLKLNAEDGGIAWQKSYSWGVQDILLSVFPVPGTGFAVAGFGADGALDFDGRLLLVDETGGFSGSCVTVADTAIAPVSILNIEGVFSSMPNWAGDAGGAGIRVTPYDNYWLNTAIEQGVLTPANSSQAIIEQCTE